MRSYGAVIDIEHLLISSDRELFRNMQTCEHCLSHLLPPRKDNDIELRSADYNFLFPICIYELHRRSFCCTLSF